MHSENATAQMQPSGSILHCQQRADNREKKTFARGLPQEPVASALLLSPLPPLSPLEEKQVLARITGERSKSNKHLPQPLCTAGTFQRSSPWHGIGWARCQLLRANACKSFRSNFLSTRGNIHPVSGNSLSSRYVGGHGVQNSWEGSRVCPSPSFHLVIS